MANANMNFPDFLLNLPKLENFNPAFALYEYEGVWLPAPYLEATLILQDKFQAQPSDIFLCSFPKTGTTWLKALAFAIMTRDLFNETTSPLVTSIPHECLPMLDEFVNDSFSHSRKDVPLMATHNPYKLLPRSIIQSRSKIVYIFREPKDTFTSLWHMTDRMQNSTILSSKDSKPLSMEELFEDFCAGRVAYGSYWDHVLGYWKASIEKPDRFLFLKYEDMKRDSIFYVKKLAEFMGNPFSIDEINETVPEKIVKMCSFEELSNLEVNKTGRLKALRIENKVFFRKGEIGDWKNHLTEDMRKKIDMITIQKLQNTGLTFL